MLNLKKISQIRQLYINEDGKLRKRILIASITTVIGILFFLWYLIRVFIYDGEFNINNHINLTKSGLIGNCISGICGTFFSFVGIIVLFETLSLQRKEFDENRKIVKFQIFDNTFFNLLKLYQEVLFSLQDDDYNSSSDNNKVIGKKYFNFKKNESYKNFVAEEPYNINRNKARKYFEKYYENNRYELALYFRTIYRIYKFIDESSLSNNEKFKYSKIVRAQLSDSEVYFIYYDSFSKNGKEFRELILKYNILKHLRCFEKLEYKNYKIRLKNYNEIEKILLELKTLIKDSINSKTNKRNRINEYKINVIYINEYSISIQINTNKNDDYSTTLLDNLIIDFIYDLLIYSNYYTLNKDLKITSKLIFKNDRVIYNYNLINQNCSIKY